MQILHFINYNIFLIIIYVDGDPNFLKSLLVNHLSDPKERRGQRSSPRRDLLTKDPRQHMLIPPP